jgi:4-hydroxybenzoate polyprenyltransferase
MRLNKPIGIFLLLWPTLWALWIANHGIPPFKILLLFIIGVIIMRSAGCIINDIADRNFDHHVKRTQTRPLAVKKITVQQAFFLFIVLITIAFLIVIQFNWLTVKLALLGLGFTIIYPLMKRITHLPQLFLGIAFTWGIPLAFAASQNKIPTLSWILFTGTLFWVVAYDTQYAMIDREDDLKLGLKSTAILFGSYDKIMIGILQSLFLILIVVCGWLLHLNLIFFLFLFASAGLVIYQQRLIYNRFPHNCFKAFLNNHWIGFLIFLGIAFSYQ